MDIAQIPLRGLTAPTLGTRVWPILAAAALLWLAAAGRALPLLAHRNHPDESLYASFGWLIASGRDPLLAGVVVDKPPLPFYLSALSFGLWGPTELAARLPNFYASLISVALTIALARQLYDSATAGLAGWLLALSPFAILFAVTAFIDPLVTMFLLWALCARAARQRALALALAFATKQTALVFIPLVLALDWRLLPAQTTVREALRRVWQQALPLLAALLITSIIIFGWDAARHAPIGFWEQGYGDNMPNRLIRAGEVGPRLSAWLDLLSLFSGSNLFNALMLACLPARLLLHTQQPSRAALADVIIGGFVWLYLAAYWLGAFNIFDRYLLPLVPLWALLAARVLRVIAHAVRHTAYRWGLALDQRGSVRGSRSLLGFRLNALVPILLTLALAALTLPPALTAVREGYAIGGDHGAYDGLDDAARYLRTVPEGSVLYDYWLSWQWRFYLADGPVYVAWLPTPAALTTELQVFGRASPRYLVVPSWEGEAEIRAAAQAAGFAFVPRHSARRPDGSVAFVVYQLEFVEK